ncbi:MAG: Flp family type IVb pilin [Pseudomonadota bacterium]
MLTRRDLLFGQRADGEDMSSEDGATAMEYATIAGVLSVVSVAVWVRWRRRFTKSAQR